MSTLAVVTPEGAVQVSQWYVGSNILVKLKLHLIVPKGSINRKVMAKQMHIHKFLQGSLALRRQSL
jgi:hypothetical protein